VKDKLNLKAFKSSITLKNKLLLAFLFIGIIPSLFIGFLLYYKSDETVEKLIYSNMYDKINFLNHDINYIDKLITDEDIIIVVKNENYTQVNEEYLDYINKIDKEEYYDEYKKIKIAEIDHIICGVSYNKQKNYKIYYFSFIKKIHPYMDDIGTIFIKISLISITLSIGFSLGLSNNITYRIIKLINYTKKVEKGDLDFQIEVEKNDEIGFLIKSFNKMTYRLNELINKTYKLEIREKEAQFKALQAQISPHFLYNALDTINWSLIENGDFKTSSTLGALSEILRYSIDDFEKNVSINKEIKQVENYLKIQKSRFEDRFNYSVNIEENILKEKIPKLLLQPLVENAVVHGVENFKTGGIIKVNGYSIDNKIIIEISDNGAGINTSKLKELNERFNEKIQDNNKYKTSHIGLLNVNERIKLVYGNEYCMKIKSEVNKGTIIHLILGKINN